jgi:hypothetical protein
VEWRGDRVLRYAARSIVSIYMVTAPARSGLGAVGG